MAANRVGRALLIALLAAACEDGGGGPGPAEAGRPGPDAAPDAAQSLRDAAPPDAGRPDADAGRPDADAGRPDADAGRPDADAGRPDADAGWPDDAAPSARDAALAADAGPGTDAGPPPTCHNFDLDPGETGVDCGGPCRPCPQSCGGDGRCPAGQLCLTDFGCLVDRPDCAPACRDAPPSCAGAVCPADQVCLLVYPNPARPYAYCTRLRREGESCRPQVRDREAPVCGPGLACRDEACVPRVGLGEPCEATGVDSTCREDLACLPGPDGQRACAPARANGEPCVGTSECRWGAYCHFDEGTCQPRSGPGDVCHIGGSHCRFPADGEPGGCFYESRACLPGLNCAPPDAPGCVTSRECGGGVCCDRDDANLCLAPQRCGGPRGACVEGPAPFR